MSGMSGSDSMRAIMTFSVSDALKAPPAPELGNEPVLESALESDSPAHQTANSNLENLLVWPSVALNRPFVLQQDLPIAQSFEGSATAFASTAPVAPELSSKSANGRNELEVATALAGVPGLHHTARIEFSGVVQKQGYRIGNLGFLTGYDTASELSEMLPIFPLPGTSRWVRGLINLHGNIVPVFDFAVMLGIEQMQRGNMLLILGHADARAAVLIDGMPERKRLTAADQLDNAVLPSELSNYVRAVYAPAQTAADAILPRDATRADIGFWMDFDHARFFDDMMPRMLH